MTLAQAVLLAVALVCAARAGRAAHIYSHCGKGMAASSACVRNWAVAILAGILAARL